MSGEATNEIYIFFHFTSEILAIFNKKSYEFSFSYIQPFQQRGTFYFFQAICIFWSCRLKMDMRAPNSVKILVL